MERTASTKNWQQWRRQLTSAKRPKNHPPWPSFANAKTWACSSMKRCPCLSSIWTLWKRLRHRAGTPSPSTQSCLLGNRHFIRHSAKVSSLSILPLASKKRRIYVMNKKMWRLGLSHAFTTIADASSNVTSVTSFIHAGSATTSRMTPSIWSHLHSLHMLPPLKTLQQVSSNIMAWCRGLGELRHTHSTRKPCR